MKRELAISIMALAVASASFIVAITSPVQGATVRMYSPGGAPCAGVCSLAWAAGEFEVPVGEPERMVIPAGSSIVKMSYGRDGKPYWLNDSALLAEDQPGMGYQVPGTSFWMVRLDECQNWALVTLGQGETYALAAPEPVPVWTTVSYYPPEAPPSFYYPPVTTCCFSNPPDEPPVIEPPTSPVPLPASIWMLAVALGGLKLVTARKA